MVDPRRLDAEPGDDIAGVAGRARQVEKAVARQVLAHPGRQDDVLGQRHVGHGGMAQPFLGHETDSGLAAAVRRQVAHRPPVQLDRLPPLGPELADQRRHEQGLAVARHPGDADDLAGPHLQPDIVQVGAELRVRRHGKPVEAQTDLAGRAPVRCRRGERFPQHHLGQAAGGFLARRAGRDDLAAAQDGGVLAQDADFFQLVRDIEDRAALAGEPAQGLEQDLDLLRRQDRGRLVHDDELRILQQAAHDLDALALADRKIADHEVRVEPQAVAGRDLDDPAAQVALRQLRRHAERDVLRYRQRLEQREMLEDHADAFGARLRRPVRRERLAAQGHGAGIGSQHAVDDLHQGGLAGAVLAEQGVDFAFADAERYVVVRQHAGERSGNPVETEKGLRHAVHPPRLRRPRRRVDGEAARRPRRQWSQAPCPECPERRWGRSAAPARPRRDRRRGTA